MEERILFKKVQNVDSLCCVLGLNFPDSATEFQKAALTLAHLMASLRDFVLKGVEVPQPIIDSIFELSTIVCNESGKQL